MIFDVGIQPVSINYVSHFTSVDTSNVWPEVTHYVVVGWRRRESELGWHAPLSGYRHFHEPGCSTLKLVSILAQKLELYNALHSVAFSDAFVLLQLSNPPVSLKYLFPTNRSSPYPPSLIQIFPSNSPNPPRIISSGNRVVVNHNLYDLSIGELFDGFLRLSERDTL